MDSIDALRDRLGSIRERLQLEGRGPYRCPLPDHEDRSPSFSVYVRNGRERWKCHGCGCGGDVLDLEAELRRVTLAALLRELRAGETSRGRLGDVSGTSQRRTPAPPARPDPKRRREVAALWRSCLDAAEAPNRERHAAWPYLVRRLGSADLASQAVSAGLVGFVLPGSTWLGSRLRGPWLLALPLAEAPPIGAPVGPEDALTCDLVRRAVQPVSGDRPRLLSLRQAAPGVLRVFGSLGAALAEADAGDLHVVEGALNQLAARLAYGPAVVGLHGAATAPRFARALEAEVRHLREQGVAGPHRLVIDTDDDAAGDRAATAVASAAHALGIDAARVAREGRRREIA